jgi:hypothetical protein
MSLRSWLKALFAGSRRRTEKGTEIRKTAGDSSIEYQQIKQESIEQNKQSQGKVMGKNLSVLSINFPFKTPWVVQQPTLATPRAFFDSDVVVIRPYLLVGRQAKGPWEINGQQYHSAKHEMTGKIDDTVRLLEKGGLLVVILDAVQELKYDTGRHTYTSGTVYTATNYDFLDGHFYSSVRNGIGTNVDILDSSEPFSAVIKSSSVEWTSFLAGKPPSPFEDTSFFARSGPRSFVGGHVPMGIGHIVFLPNFENLDEDKFFEACREYRYRREGTTAPEWSKVVFLPGALEADEQIERINLEINEIERLRKEATAARNDLLAYKKLLYEKGKVQLEPMVRKTLDQLGFGTTSSETIPGTGFEIDGRTTRGSISGILEIKGSKNQITLDEFSPFIPKILADMGVSGSQSKGILIGNGLCETQPADRCGQTVFSSHVLSASKTQSIALVNSVELYCVLCGVLSHEILDLDPIREKILNTSGFVDLLEFCPHMPFTKS